MSKNRANWDQPPRGALQWLRACIEQAKLSAARMEAQDFERHSERYGVETARRWRKEERKTARQRSVMIALTLKLPEAEREALRVWWNEPVPEESLAPEASPVRCNGDAKPGRATSGAMPRADDPKG